MLYFVLKAALSGLIIAAASELARRAPALGALILSLPLISLLAFIWLWRDTGDAARIAALSQSTFWYVLPTLPMFLLIPALLRLGVNFWLALAAGCALTFALYLLTVWALGKAGIAQRPLDRHIRRGDDADADAHRAPGLDRHRFRRDRRRRRPGADPGAAGIAVDDQNDVVPGQFYDQALLPTAQQVVQGQITGEQAGELAAKVAGEWRDFNPDMVENYKKWAKDLSA